MSAVLASGTRARRRSGRSLALLVLAGVAISICLTAATSEAQLYQADPQTDQPAPAAREASRETTVMLDPLYLARIITDDDLYALPLEGEHGGVRLGNPEYLMNFSVARVGADGSVTAECVPATRVDAALGAEEVSR